MCRSLHACALAATLTGWFATATGAAETVTPPVPLRTSTPMVPDQLAGSGVVPEARVKAGIDARGKVTSVEVLSIAPPTGVDDLLSEEIVRAVSRWRYAPQKRDGVPEPTSLSWRISFPPRSPSRGLESESISPLAVSFLPGGDAERRRATILAMPEVQRLELLRAQAAIAKKFLAPERTRSVDSPRFLVLSDADDDKTAEAIGGNLEAIYNTISERLLPGIEMQPEKYKVVVVAYRDAASYQSLLGELPMFEWSAGFYNGVGLLAFHLEQPSSDAVTSLLLHEATHAFLDRHVVRRGVALPRWLGEGFADYVGNSRIKNGVLLPGKTLKGKYELFSGMVARVETAGAVRLDKARSALKAGKGLSVEQLLSASEDTFYGEARDLYYSTSWLFVHFLRDGSVDWNTTRFPRALLYLAEGYPAESVIPAIYGEVPALDAAFRGYVRSF